MFFFKGPRSLMSVSRSFEGRYLFSFKEKLFSFSPRTGRVSVLLEKGLFGEVPGPAAGRRFRVLESAGTGFPSEDGAGYNVLEISFMEGNVRKRSVFNKPVLFALSVGERRVVGIAHSSRGHVEVLFSSGDGGKERKLGSIPVGWNPEGFSWAVPSVKPRFFSLSFNDGEPDEKGVLSSYLFIYDLVKKRGFSFWEKHKPPGIPVHPEAGLPMGWYGGRYLLTSGLNAGFIDALNGKVEDFRKGDLSIKDNILKIGAFGSYGNCLCFRRKGGEKRALSPKTRRVGAFLVGERLTYADGERIREPEGSRNEIGAVSLHRLSQGGRFALLYVEKGKRLWLVDGERKKVHLLGQAVFDWGWID